MYRIDSHFNTIFAERVGEYSRHVCQETHAGTHQHTLVHITNIYRDTHQRIHRRHTPAYTSETHQYTPAYTSETYASVYIRTHIAHIEETH